MSGSTVNMTREEQVEAFEAAKAAITEDAADGLVDVSFHGGEPVHGDVLRVVADAYLGRQSYEDIDPEGGPDMVAVPVEDAPEKYK